MPDTDFSIGGNPQGARDPNDPSVLRPQRLLQGIGFPLRDIIGVPPRDTGDFLNPETLAGGPPMQFLRQGWVQGLGHPAGSALTNGIWAMVANTLTFDQPYPRTDGNPSFTLPAFAPLTETDTSVVTSGQQWTLTADTLVDVIRVWVPSISATTFYKITMTALLPGASSPIAFTIDNPLLTPGEFTIVSKSPNLYPAGTVLTGILQAIETSGGNAVQGVWRKQGDGTGVTSTGQWRTDGGRVLLRVNKTDQNSLDRGSDLADVGIDSTLNIVQSDDSNKSLSLLITTTPTDAGTDFIWSCVKTGEGDGGEPDNNKDDSLTFDIPIVLITEYSEELGGLANPAWATVVPFLEFGGVDQSPLADTAFGVDIEGEITVFSPDWDVFSGP